MAHCKQQRLDFKGIAVSNQTMVSQDFLDFGLN